METERQRARGDAGFGRLAEFRERVEALGKELDGFRRRLDELELALPAPPEETVPPPEAPLPTEEEGPGYLEGIQGRIHLLLREEMQSAERMPAAPASGDGMVCPSCGALADRAA